MVEKPSKSFMDIAFKAQSWMPTERNGWFIKFSIFNGDYILLIFTSMYTHQTIIREYKTEDEAVDFVNFMIDIDPTIQNNL